MITRFVIGILVFTVRLVHFALKAAWGIPKGGSVCNRNSGSADCAVCSGDGFSGGSSADFQPVLVLLASAADDWRSLCTCESRNNRSIYKTDTYAYKKCLYAAGIRL